MKKMMKNILILLFCVGFLAMGCATIPTRALPPGEPDWDPKVLASSTELNLIVRDSSGMSNEDLEEMGDLFQKVFKEQGKQIKAGAENTLTITFLEFDKGSQTARTVIGMGAGTATISALVVLKNQTEIARGIVIKRVGCPVWQKGCVSFPGFRGFSSLKEIFTKAVVK